MLQEASSLAYHRPSKKSQSPRAPAISVVRYEDGCVTLIRRQLLTVQCDGAKPCTSCRASNAPCQYSGSDGRKKQDWKDRIEALEQRNHDLEQQIEELKHGRAENIQWKELEPVTESDSGLGGSMTTAGSAVEENETAQHSVPGSMGTEDSHYGDIPNERTTRVALNGFFKYAAMLFSVTTEERADQLMQKVYHTDDASMGDISELSAIAMFGSHYNINDASDTARASYCFLASSGLNKSIQSDPVQGMRIFICLCLSSITDKSSNARLLIGMSRAFNISTKR